MDTNRKLELAQMAVDSLATDTSKDSSLRKAALQNLKDRCEKAIAKIDEDTAAEIAQLES